MKGKEEIARHAGSKRAYTEGDVVQLKSGSPAMTIEYFSADHEEASVSWYEMGQILNARIHLHALQYYQMEKDPNIFSSGRI